ncbi:MAG: adenine-specific methyltransferase EcoRI family protein [Armatimonadetes bacterium]|nr:adenine-specific methyltransferase EcoRI family protein [Armatimonadota bacterium]
MNTDPARQLNRTLSAAKKAKQDEFYTQYDDIQNEVAAYLEHDPNTFRGKVVYCNCDDPFESHFFKYFAVKFNELGLRKLITTSYDGSPIAGGELPFTEFNAGNGTHQKPKALAVELAEVKDLTGDGAAAIEDVKLFLERNPHTRTPLAGGGDFRSAECVAFLKEADIVVTNPPFSLFREYVAQLVEHDKKFLIIANKNAITYKEIFPLIKRNEVWTGVKAFSGGMWFMADYSGKYEKIVDGVKLINVPAIWFTNLDHRRRHEKLELMTMEDNLKFSKHKEIRGKAAYDRYANYDAIEVPFTDAIPSDYDGEMGVPITFLDKYNPEQFEILGSSRTLGAPMAAVAEKGSYVQGGPRFYIATGDGTYRRMYDRLVIRHRR